MGLMSTVLVTVKLKPKLKLYEISGFMVMRVKIKSGNACYHAE